MASENEGGLKRSLGLFPLIAYGVGDILGAGIYALVGKIAGIVGNACWLSFLISFVVACLAALSYAELASRFPHSGGEAHYTLRAFGKPVLSYAVGFLVLMSGVVSMAAVSHGFAGYVRAVFPWIPLRWIAAGFFLVLGAITFRGMEESSVTNIICTAVELSGLLIVIAVGIAHFGKVDYFAFSELAQEKGTAGALFQGGILAFYAFIGFEDMVKAAEEAHSPQTHIPQALLTSLAVIGCFYILTALAAVSVVPSTELARSEAPLMMVVERGAPWIPRGLFTVIALFAVTNTALVNFVMSSRLLYGMAEEGLVPRILSRVHPVRRTPHAAITVVFVLALALALTGTISRLAQSTAVLLLIVFFIVNLSLVAIKMRDKGPAPVFSVPIAAPVLGAAAALFLTFHVSHAALATAGALVGLALLLFLFGRRY
jgi:amino acid transporter